MNIKNREVRNSAETMVIDQNLIAQNGGAETMIAQTKAQLAEYDQAIATSTESARSISADGSIPTGVTNPTNMLGALGATIDVTKDARLATQATLDILQCWAGQPGMGGIGAPSAARAAKASQAAMMSKLLSQLKSGRPADPQLVRDLERQAADAEKWRSQFEELQRAALENGPSAASDPELLAKLQDSLGQLGSKSEADASLQNEFDLLTQPSPESSPDARSDPSASASAAAHSPNEEYAAPDTCPPGARQLDGSCAEDQTPVDEADRDQNTPSAGERDPEYSVSLDDVEGPLGALRGVAEIDLPSLSPETKQFLKDAEPYLKLGLEQLGPDGEMLSEAISKSEQVAGYWKKFTDTADYASKVIDGTVTNEDHAKNITSGLKDLANSDYLFSNKLAGKLTGRAISGVEAATTTAMGKLDEAMRIFNEGGSTADMNNALQFEDVGLAAAAAMCPICVSGARMAQKAVNTVTNAYNALNSLLQ